MVMDMKKQGVRGRKHQKRLEQERRVEALDNWDIIDTSENKPSDYWAIKEMQEEYYKELYGSENYQDE